MDKSLITLVLLLVPVLALAQTHTMPGSNVVPSGASLTIQSGASITAAGGSTVTGFGGGTGTVTSLTATAPIVVTPSPITTTGVISITPGAFEVPLTFSQSLSRVTNTVTLSGDSASPGNTMLYGTNGSGTKGWYAQPAAGAAVANPSTQLLGLTAINGSASTAMRSDGAPALDQTIAPTWTGLHTWKISNAATNTVTDVLTVGHNSSGSATTSFGTGVLFTAEDSSTDDVGIGEIRSLWTTATHNSNTSDMVFRMNQSSANPVTTVMTLHGTGQIVDAQGGFQVAGAAASGKILIGDGTKFITSTPAYPNLSSSSGAIIQSNGSSFVASTPVWPTGAGSAGAIVQSTGTNFNVSTPTWPTTAGTVGYLVRSDGTNFASYPNQQTNSSTANLTPSTSDIYLTGSSCVVAAGDFKQKGQYRCVFDMAKSAGTGAIVISVRIGTAGTTSDTAQVTFTFGAGTSVADSGVFDVVVNWRSVGTGSSAVVQGICRGTHNLTTTGLFNNAAGWVIIGTPSGGFNSSTATTIGLSFNGSTAFAGTNTLVQAQLQQ